MQIINQIYCIGKAKEISRRDVHEGDGVYYAVYRHAARGRLQPVVSDRFDDPPLTSWIYLLTQFRVLVTYIQLLFVPIHQNLDYDFPASGGFLEFHTLASFGILSGIFITAILLFPCRRLEALGILWFFLTLSEEQGLEG